MSEIHELTFQPGLIVNQEFFDYPAMQESGKNWLLTSKYRFGTGEFYGRHDGAQLNNLQFGHAHRHEGMVLEGIAPKDFSLSSNSIIPMKRYNVQIHKQQMFQTLQVNGDFHISGDFQKSISHSLMYRHQRH